MKERPILFSAPMVNAILNGTKIVTRRTNGLDRVNLNPEARTSAHYVNDGYWDLTMHDGTWHGLIKCPYGQVGDQLWVRETWKPGAWRSDARVAIDYAASPEITNTPWIHPLERADYFVVRDFFERMDAEIESSGLSPDENGFYHWEPGKSPMKWRPSIHMPRWASRIQLEITNIRVERLQDISRKDAIAEGAPPSHPSIDKVSREFGYEDFSRSWYAQLWETINGAGSWDANPWVWVIEFKVINS